MSTFFCDFAFADTFFIMMIMKAAENTRVYWSRSNAAVARVASRKRGGGGPPSLSANLTREGSRLVDEEGGGNF